MEKFQTIVASLVSGLLAYFRPLGDEIFILSMVFFVNFFCGLVVDMRVNDASFQFKKAWKCVVEITIFFAMCVFVFVFGEKKGSVDGAMQCVSFLTYVISWFYAQNILRNLKSTFPKHSTAYLIISFLYWFVGVEFIKKIPSLKDFMKESEDVCNNETAKESLENIIRHNRHNGRERGNEESAHCRTEEEV